MKKKYNDGLKNVSSSVSWFIGFTCQYLRIPRDLVTSLETQRLLRVHTDTVMLLKKSVREDYNKQRSVILARRAKLEEKRS